MISHAGVWSGTLQTEVFLTQLNRAYDYACLQSFQDHLERTRNRRIWARIRDELSRSEWN